MTAPLPLDSPRWRELKAHFGNAGNDTDLLSVPRLLARWQQAVGSYREEWVYADLRESFLHQGTILDVAYAVVPHLASHLARLDPDRRREVCGHLVRVEAVRLLSAEEVEARVDEVAAAFPEAMRAVMVATTRDRLARLPRDLEPAYLHAMSEIEAVAGPHWMEDGKDADDVLQPRSWRRHVSYLRGFGWRDDDIAFAVNALRAEVSIRVPVIGETKVSMISCGSWEDSRRALCALDDVPPGWFERTWLRRPEGELAFRAVHALAYYRLLAVDTILGPVS